MMRLLALSLLLAGGAALAQASSVPSASDADALLLADTTPSTIARASDWRVFAESALSQSTQRAGSAPAAGQRLSFDLAYDGILAPGWRAVLADRLDLDWQRRFDNETSVNTLKEAYLSWQFNPDQLLDLGRINTRYGVATGYNPTDFFRGGAVRSVVSADPDSLRRNRLGSVMLRSQSLWAGGGLTALVSPKLTDAPSDAPFSADLGATNNRNRWLLSGSQQLGAGFSPQWSFYSEQHASPQLGLNLTALLNNATVAYVEWSGGRSRSLRPLALNGADDSAFRSRLATGITYTTASKLTWTLEYEYNGAGLDKAGWDALRRGAPPAYLQYRRFAGSLQELPTRQAIFVRAGWQDAIVARLDLSALARLNIADRSRMTWLEARYHWDRADLALQWQLNAGAAASEFGALPQRRMAQAVLTYFF
jgi:opacity protein-like surface antigen